jgi:murein DD-endopeptidase MepM/ murein hydrolase activator NlpD
MIRRKLPIALAVAAMYAALLATTASAEPHTVRVTLVTGQVLVMTIDVPPGGSPSASQLPGLPAPVESIEDLGPIGTPTPVPTPDLPVPTPELPAPGAPTPAPGTPEAPGAGQGGTQPGGADGRPADAPTQAEQEAVRAGGKVRRGADPNTDALNGELRRAGRKARDRAGKAPGRNVDGTPTLDNPTFSLALPGAAPIGVPNFFIDKFRIPPFLLPIYQAAGIQYGVRWEVLAAINEIETDYGRNLNISSAGALGWMQFMPATWDAYGVDANQDGVKDPFNPVDAIFAAARYLRAAGAETDLEKAIFAYNHADWYVDSVLLRARVIGGLPSNLVGSLTGLTQGRFPVHAKATYADDLSERELKQEARKNPAVVVESSGQRRGIKIFARKGAPVIAANDGRIVKIGRTERLGRFVQLQDVYGNTYTYAHLKAIAERYPAPKPQRVTKEQIAEELELPRKDAAPTGAASDSTAPAARAPRRGLARKATPSAARTRPRAAQPTARTGLKERLFAHPTRPKAAEAGGAQQEFERTGKIDGSTTFESYFSRVFGLDRKDVHLRRLKRGSTVVAGTILGRIGRTSARSAPHVLFEIRPAGRGAPRIDPKPILDGWKLLESTAIYRAAGRNPFFGSDAETPSIGQILLMSKDALAQRVLANPRVEIYGCGRTDVQAGQIDRRVLATLEFLAASGFKPTVTSLKCGHGFFTASGNVSHHSSGNAVDIAAINGIPVTGHQGEGSITELAVQRLLTLQGTMKPDQIITLMRFDGTDNTYAMADHHDHIHVGWQPLYGTNSKLAKQVNAVLKPQQWIKLIDRLGEIDNPTVRRAPSRFAVKVTRRGSHAHEGE